MKAWDVSYWSEKLKEARYAFSDQTVKQYFTAPKVVAGLFSIIERLFDVSDQRKRKPRSGTTPSSSTRCAVAASSSPSSTSTCTPAMASGPGAWMDEVRSRWLKPTGEQQTPVALLDLQLRVARW